MAPRSDLQTLLVQLLGTDAVYFQPPPSVKLTYPCIIYRRDSAKTEFADNNPYKHMKRYQITVIDRNPDSDIPAKIALLPKCRFDRFFTTENLNHDVYNIFF
jgi:hypothetical protein